MWRRARLDFQTKIIVLLVSVIVPTFALVTVIQNKVAQPILEQEMRQLGVATAEALELKILTNQWLSKPSFYPVIESEMQEQIYLQPSIFRMEVFLKDHQSGNFNLIASTVEYEPGAVIHSTPPQDATVSTLRNDGPNDFWEVEAPIRGGMGKQRTKPIGKILLRVSTRTVHRVLNTFWRVTVIGAVISVIILVAFLSFLLRKAVQNEKLLHIAESQNIQLSQKLHEAHREVMNMEKLAVMGQLTANFAHEIGTPLNAVGGHLQLLSNEVSSQTGGRAKERLSIIQGELKRIENIVKGFLQTTSKPSSQTQLVDFNSLIDKTLAIVSPRLDGLGVGCVKDLDRSLGPLRVVPLDIEQVFLNLFNNALDSIQEKVKLDSGQSLELKVTTQQSRMMNQDFCKISIRDTGMGISANDIKNVLKPFFTTKRPGEGTGLGLTICKQLVEKYGGSLELESKEKEWTEIVLLFPYQSKV